MTVFVTLCRPFLSAVAHMKMIRIESYDRFKGGHRNEQGEVAYIRKIMLSALRAFTARAWIQCSKQALSKILDQLVGYGVLSRRPNQSNLYELNPDILAYRMDTFD